MQEHNGMEFPIAFLSHTFTETQRKWSTTEQEAYGVYYAVTKWNYYLQGTDIIVRNDCKPLAKFLNGKNANNKLNRWGLELATYKIMFKWISGAKNKAADCLSSLVEQLPATSTMINMLTVTHTDGPAFSTRSQTKQDPHATNSIAPPDVAPTFPQILAQHTNLLQQIDWKLCRRPIHSANAYLSNYSVEKHPNMKQIFSLTSVDCYINT